MGRVSLERKSHKEAVNYMEDLKEYYIRTVWDYNIQACLYPKKQNENYWKLVDWLNEFGMVDGIRDQLAVIFWATQKGAEALRDEMLELSECPKDRKPYFYEPVLCLDAEE